MNGNPTQCSILSGITYVSASNDGFATCEIVSGLVVIKNFNTVDNSVVILFKATF